MIDRRPGPNGLLVFLIAFPLAIFLGGLLLMLGLNLLEGTVGVVPALSYRDSVIAAIGANLVLASLRGPGAAAFRSRR